MSITDLTGYTWVGNSSLSNIAPSGTDITSKDGMSENYAINFTCNNVSYTYFNVLDRDYSPYGYFYSNEALNGDNGTTLVYTESWISDSFKTIQIIGGTDATNSNLIAWLQNNGTLTQSAPSSNFEMWFGDKKIESIAFVQNGTTKEVVDTSLDLPKPLQECSWTEIKQICKDGNAKKYWQVGDTKTITCTDGYTYTIRIVDMQEGRYAYVSDNSPTHCVFELQQTYSTTQYLASSGASEVGLYKNTPMHTTYLPNILKTFNDIKNVLENVYITCLTSINDDTFESVSAKVFLPSAVEYMDYTLSTSSYNARMNMERISPYDNTLFDVFDYYKTHSAEKKKITDGTIANTYWTRLYQVSGYWNVIATPIDQSGTTISNQYPALRNGNPSKSWVIFCFAL